jgi:hypothetical protein
MGFSPAHCTAPLLALASSGAQHGTAGTGAMAFLPAHCIGTTAGTGSALAHSTPLALGQWLFLPSALHGTTAGTGLSFSGAQHGTAGTGGQWGLSPSARTAPLLASTSALWRTARHCWHWGNKSAHCTAPLLALVFSSSGAQHGTVTLGGNGLFSPLHGTTCWHWPQPSGAQHGTAGKVRALSP